MCRDAMASDGVGDLAQVAWAGRPGPPSAARRDRTGPLGPVETGMRVHLHQQYSRGGGSVDGQ